MSIQKACGCSHFHILEEDCDGCVRCLPRSLCVSVKVSDDPAVGAYAQELCCKEFNFQLLYYCFRILPSGDSVEVKSWIGDGGCGGTDDPLLLLITTKAERINGECQYHVVVKIKITDETIVDAYYPIIDGVIPSVAFLATSTTLGVIYDVTIASGVSGYSINPLAVQNCPLCMCTDIVCTTICAELHVFIRLGYGGLPGEVAGMNCGRYSGAVLMDFDCLQRKWIQRNDLIIDGNTYTITAKLADNGCVVIFSVEGGPFVPHDVGIPPLLLPANTGYYLLAGGQDPCFGIYRCRGTGSFFVGKGKRGVLCEPGPEDTNIVDFSINPVLDLQIPSTANEPPNTGGHTAPNIGRLIIKSLPCGGECEARSLHGCPGACPAFDQQPLECSPPPLIINCEIVAPGCHCDGTVFPMFETKPTSAPPTVPKEGDCQHFFSDSELVCLEADEGVYTLGVTLGYDISSDCERTSPDLRGYRLGYQINTTCGDATSTVTSGILTPNLLTSTCSPPVLEFIFPSGALRPKPGLPCDCCPDGITGDTIFRITL